MKHGLVPEAWLPGADGAPVLTTLSAGDSFRLVQPFATKAEWQSALSAALVEQVSRSETDRYIWSGIPHLECVEEGLAQLGPKDLAAVLAVGAGSMEDRPWQAIAQDALGRLTPAQREELKAAAALENENPTRQNSLNLVKLLEGN